MKFNYEVICSYVRHVSEEKGFYQSVALISKTIAKVAVFIRGGTYLMKGGYKKKQGMRYASFFNTSSSGH